MTGPVRSHDDAGQMSTPKDHTELQGIAADLNEACALVSANLVRAATAANPPSAEINVEARLYPAAAVIWSIRRPGTATGSAADALLDAWLAAYLADLHPDAAAVFLRALDHRTAQYIVLWEAGGDWAFNTARFLGLNMRINADADTLSALGAAVAAVREAIDRFVQLSLAA